LLCDDKKADDKEKKTIHSKKGIARCTII